ncbi:unnamed protein product [Rhizophagus irregularis]|nr:unnamed protein product [Rhizophagus irregularis]
MVFLGDSFSFLKHEFDGSLSDFADSLNFSLGFGNLFFEFPDVDFDGSSGLSRCSILFFNSLDAGLQWDSLDADLVKLAPAWKPKSQASNASLDGFIRDVNFSID